MLVALRGQNSHFRHPKSMSGFPNRRQQHLHQNQDDTNSGSSPRRPSSGTPHNPTSSTTTTSSTASLDNLRTSQEQQLMAGASLSSSANTATYPTGLLPPRGGNTMASFQDPLDPTTRTSSLYARMHMAQAQRAQQQLQLDQQFQLEHQQRAASAQFQLRQQQEQAVAAAAVAAQQEEIEFNSLLLQKRHIDDMILNSAFGGARRFSMDSNFPPSLYGASAPTGSAPARLPGQAATGLPLSMSASAASMMGNRNASNRPILTEPDLLSGKIGVMGGQRGPGGLPMSSWADQSRRLSDPHHNRLGMMATAGMGGAVVQGSTAMTGSGQPHDDEVGAGGGVYEEDDEAYFNDAGTDEVDRDFKRSQENFPLKLYRIIYEVVKSGRGDVISFFPHGRAFAVHKPKEFINEIMPKYFATGRMNTFLKQLNLYGFRRITEGRDKGGYFHPKFVLGKRHMCKLIKRKKTDSKPAVAKVAPPTKSPETKEADDGRSSPVSTEEYGTSLNQQMEKQRRAQREEAKSARSPSPQSHPKLRWKRPTQETD